LSLTGGGPRPPAAPERGSWRSRPVPPDSCRGSARSRSSRQGQVAPHQIEPAPEECRLREVRRSDACRQAEVAGPEQRHLCPFRRAQPQLDAAEQQVKRCRARILLECRGCVTPGGPQSVIEALALGEAEPRDLPVLRG